MSGRILFIRRFLQEWRYQYKIFRTVLDWTVVFYIAVPALVFLCIFYFEAWDNVHNYWHADIPLLLFFMLILMLTAGGNYRTFLQEADLLYLLQRRNTIVKLKLYGLLASSIGSFLWIVFILILTLPITLQNYRFSSGELLNLLLVCYAYRVANQSLRKASKGSFIKKIFNVLLFIVTLLTLSFTHPMISSGLSIFVIIILTGLHFRQLNHNQHFLRELEIESEEKVKYIKIIMNFSLEVEKPKGKQRKKPLLWRNSRSIFREITKEKGILEFLLKAFLRKDGKSYLRLNMVTVTALILTPYWLKWAMYLCFMLFLNYWVNSLFKRMLKNHFFTLVPLPEEMKSKVSQSFKRYLMLPAVVLFATFTVVLTIISIKLS